MCCFFYPHVCSFQCWNAVGGFREWLVGIIDCRKMWMSFLFLGFCWCSFFVCLLLRAREWKQRNSQGDYTMKWTHTVVTNKCRGCFRVWFHSVRFMSLLFSHFFSLSLDSKRVLFVGDSILLACNQNFCSLALAIKSNFRNWGSIKTYIKTDILKQ